MKRDREQEESYMTIRLTGMASGLDTDSMVQELVKASSSKKETLEKAQTKLGWTQTAWSDLNTKVYSFFNGSLNNVRFQGAYKKKTTSVADSKVATIVAGDNATNGTQSLSVKQLAKSGYLTGGKLSDSKKYTANSRMSELGAVSDGETANITVTTGSGKTTNIALNSDMTVSSFVSELNKAGVTASFDETNQRFFVSSSASGGSNDFTIAAASGDSNGSMALAAMGLVTSSDVDSDTTALAGLTKGSAEYQTALDQTLDRIKQTYEDKNTALQTAITENNTKRAEYLAGKVDPNDESSKTYQEIYDEIEPTAGGSTTDKITTIQTALENLEKEDPKAEDYDARKAELNKQLNVLNKVKGFEDTSSNYSNEITANEALIAGTDNTTLADMAEKQLDAKIAAAYNATHQTSATGAVRVQGQDAVIQLNGAEFTSTDNSFNINGLTITATAVSEKTLSGYVDALGNATTKDDPDATAVYDYAETTINTADDVDGIYKMIKGFFSDYNKLINEMDSLYNASSSKGYEPLTTEEKDAMTDTEVTEWEKKIKDSLLRRDDNLNSVIYSMKEAMMQSFKVDGSDRSLTYYGIETLSYFSAKDNEKGAYHIDGDSEDSSTSGNKDKLKTAIATDPEGVMSFFSQLTTNLYDTLNKQMKSVKNTRSVNKVYDDKKMQSEYDDYTSKIKKQEEKLTALEDRYYAQFSTMESAMTKLNSQQSYISSLFG